MFLSVITVHLNDYGGLSRTLESIRESLHKPGLEWFVIDGARNPHPGESQQLIAEIEELASGFRSEPDQGIYDAMNKGTALAKGVYVLYLNAGDELHPEFDLNALIAELRGGRPAMIWGRCHERYESGELVRVKNRSPSLAWYGMPVNHQNVLFRRDLLGVSPYNLEYEISADYDLVSRILKQGGKVFRTSIPFAIFQRGGANERRLTVTLEEEAKLRTLHYGVPPAISQGIKRLKILNARLGQVPALRRLMRKWV